ncbi:MAG: cyclodeaminase/cyclohydrolase family protein, partial [Bacillota bacterium]
MSEVFEWSFRKVVEISASDSPTPGGGSVSALVASLGAAMVAMVSNLTVGKEKYKDVEPQVIGIRDSIYKVISRLEELVDMDIAEFANFMKVLRMPKDSDEQKAERTAKMQGALKSATDTPLEIASTCLEALRLAHQLAG